MRKMFWTLFFPICLFGQFSDKKNNCKKDAGSSADCETKGEHM
jgi:hypothetical protein